MGDIQPGTPRFVIHELTEEERVRYRGTPRQSILKSPTAVFSTSELGTPKRLTFADGDNGCEKETTPVANSSAEQLLEIAISPTKILRVSPRAWKSHQKLKRLYHDYANETEKTDYLYSPLSPYFGREIAPGVSMPPNMCRPALRSYSLSAPVSPYSSPKSRRNFLPNLGLWLIIPGKQSQDEKFVNNHESFILYRLRRMEERLQYDKVKRMNFESKIHNFLRDLKVEMSWIRTRFINCRRICRRTFLIDYENAWEVFGKAERLLEEVRGNGTKSGDFFGTVQDIVHEALKKYDADKTGLADYALKTAGGRVVSIGCTQPWPGIEAFSFDPESAIRKGVAPGECWAFQGEGKLILELTHSIRVSACSIEHISATIHPKGVTASAPKEFSLWGLKNINDTSPHFFGTFFYDIALDTVQTFPIIYTTDAKFRLVEVVLSTNHGHPYTCLYRVRIHGSLGL